MTAPDDPAPPPCSPVDRVVREMLEIALAVVSAEDVDAAVAELPRALVREMEFRAAIVRLLDPETGELSVAGSAGLSAEYLAGRRMLAPPGSLDDRVLRGEVVELRDVTVEPSFEFRELARREGLRGVLAAPVIQHGEPRGILRAYTADDRAFTDEERGVLVALARLCGQAIDNARQRAALTAIVRALGSTLDVREVVDRMLRHTVEYLGFRGAVLRLLDEEDGVLRLAGARGLSRRYLRAGERRPGMGLDARVLAGETVVIQDLEREGGLPYAEAALAEGIRAVLATPLLCPPHQGDANEPAFGGAPGLSRGRVVGLLRVYSRRARRFDPREVRFVRLVAELCALSLDRARLHHLLEQRLEALGQEASGWFRFLTLS